MNDRTKVAAISRVGGLQMALAFAAAGGGFAGHGAIALGTLFLALAAGGFALAVHAHEKLARLKREAGALAEMEDRIRAQAAEATAIARARLLARDFRAALQPAAADAPAGAQKEAA